MKHLQQPNGTLFNSINDNSSFADSSGTALLAASTYRLALITNDTSNIPAANRAFTLIQNSLSDDGLLHNIVDPLTFDSPGTVSPEGQSFVLLLQTAWWDWYRNTQIQSAPALSAVTSALSAMFGSVRFSHRSFSISSSWSSGTLVTESQTIITL